MGPTLPIVGKLVVISTVKETEVAHVLAKEIVVNDLNSWWRYEVPRCIQSLILREKFSL
jgi:hypothetical protein